MLVAAALMVSGCGYSTSALIRDDIHTVYIPVFDNQTWYRGLEVQLTRAVLEEVKLHSPLLIASRQDADSTLEGELVAFDQGVVTKTVDEVVVLTNATAKVNFRWVDNLTGRDIVPKQSVVEKVIVAPGAGEAIEANVFREVAKRILERMEKDW
jgi:hypothetical protein